MFTYLQGNVRALCVDDTKVHATASHRGQLAGCRGAEGHLVHPTRHGDAGQQLEGLAAPKSYLWIGIISYKWKKNCCKEKGSRLTSDLPVQVTDRQTERGDRPWRKPDFAPPPYGKRWYRGIFRAEVPICRCGSCCRGDPQLPTQLSGHEEEHKLSTSFHTVGPPDKRRSEKSRDGSSNQSATMYFHRRSHNKYFIHRSIA